MAKNKPLNYQPPDCRLTRVSNYATESGYTVPRIYQLFQEGKIELVSLDGVQFVKRPK